MPGTQTEHCEQGQTVTGPQPRARYFVLRREDAWFIIFAGEEFGPYNSDREAKLFAIDAAYKLAEQGEESEVLMADETGALGPLWMSGRDPYPPRE